MPPSAVAVDEERLRTLERRTNLELGLPEAIGEQLIRVRSRAGLAVPATGFVATDASGTDVAHASLYLADGIAQIEDVATLVAHRGAGHGKDVVAACVHAARATGASLVFLTADGDDWPQHLYASMGFVPVARVWVLQREGIAAL